MLCPRFIVSIQRHEAMDRIVIQGKPQSQRLHACQLSQLANLHFVSRVMKTHDWYSFVDSWDSFYSCEVCACWPNDAFLSAGRGCTVCEYTRFSRIFQKLFFPIKIFADRWHPHNVYLNHVLISWRFEGGELCLEVYIWHCYLSMDYNEGLLDMVVLWS